MFVSVCIYTCICVWEGLYINIDVQGKVSRGGMWRCNMRSKDRQKGWERGKGWDKNSGSASLCIFLTVG